MQEKKIAVLGSRGYVGKEMVRLFSKFNPVEYDPAIWKGSDNEESFEESKRKEVNKCDVALVCVPTNMEADGFCNTSIVEQVVGWLETPLIILRSTVPPGYTNTLRKKYAKRVVFQPEYIGETVAHPLNDSSQAKFLIFGGDTIDVEDAVELYQLVYNANVKILKMTAREAEVTKYMENSFIGTYVVFCNEFYEICKRYGVDYNVVREGFLADPRMTPYWTFVFKHARGFGGKCIPKDMAAIVAECEAATGYQPEFLLSVLENNERIKTL